MMTDETDVINSFDPFFIRIIRPNP